MEMKMPISEIADRYSILLLKSERASVVSEELKTFKEELDEYEGIFDYVDRLYKINGEIWDLEADIRQGKEGILGLEEVGRRALLIRDTNKRRIEVKNQIVDNYKEGFIDLKVNHASI